MGRSHESSTREREEDRSPPNITWARQWSLDAAQNSLSESPFWTLPSEVTLHIFGHLSAHGLGQVSLVCRQFKMIADHDELWKAKCNSE